MAFLSGSLGFERFHIAGRKPKKLGSSQLEVLRQYASGKFQTSSEENVQVGFLGGSHLLDRTFDEEKNLINNALHCGIRIDTNQVPGALKRAWMQLELAAMMKDNPHGRPTKSQREEAKEGVERRCQDELKTDKYLRMQQYPVLWDARQHLLYFGGSGASAMTHAADLFERAFEVELERINASWLVNRWATQTEQVGSLADLGITSFIDDGELPGIAWSSNEADDFSFLGNEFLMWLWWFVETQGDTIELSDETEVTLMFVKTLQLECPWGDWGREVLSSDSPIKMPEAVQAIRAGKLPRKAGFIFVRNGQQFEFVLQAETFAISSAKIVIDEPEDNPQDRVDARIDSVRCLSETVDLLFESFLDLRVSDEWAAEQKKIRRWLRPAKQSQKKPAA